MLRILEDMELDRFIEAQARVWPTPLEEIRAGRKVSHWMWFIWPQLRGLGRSPTAQHYGIEDLAEAQAYIAHPILGSRLIDISNAILAHEGTPPEAILGPVDAVKLRSSATLFEAAGGNGCFARLLDVFYGGVRCETTWTMLREG